MLEHALAYAAAWRPVFPCNERPGPHAKAPLTRQGHKEATLDPDRIRRWWTQRPKALIGAPVPRDQVCIDVDPRNGVTVRDLEAVVGKLPDTQAVYSGRVDGGVHLFFRRSLAEPNEYWEDIGGGLGYWHYKPDDQWLYQKYNTTKLRKLFPAGVDLKLDTGYTILPPSLHPDTGAPYVWRGDYEHPLDYPLFGLPAALEELILERPNKPRQTSGGVPNARALEGILRRVAEETSTRNNVLHWAACRLAENGYPEAAFDALEGAAEYAGLPRSEITKTINSAIKRTAA
jgi:hypothetical protein